MSIREKALFLVLLLALGYFVYMLITGLQFFKTYNEDSHNTASMIKEKCKATNLFVITIGDSYGGRVYDCSED